MKKMVSLIAVVCIILSLCACAKGNTSTAKEDTSEPQTAGSEQTGIAESDNVETESIEAEELPIDTENEKTESDEKESPVTDEELIDDPAWDELESIGKIETENGLFFVTITMPAELIGDDVTQETLDQNVGDTYTSAKLNEDGSVTYKMTKKQHRNMLDSFDEAADAAMQELIDSPDYAFTEITHNANYTSFDVHLSTEEIGMAEGIMALGFYMYGGIYACYSGKEVDNVAVNYYSANGELLETGNSSDMAQ